MDNVPIALWNGCKSLRFQFSHKSICGNWEHIYVVEISCIRLFYGNTSNHRSLILIHLWSFGTVHWFLTEEIFSRLFWIAKQDSANTSSLPSCCWSSNRLLPYRKNSIKLQAIFWCICKCHLFYMHLVYQKRVCYWSLEYLCSFSYYSLALWLYSAIWVSISA